MSRGFRPKIFFPEDEIPEFQNPNHPRYAPKLAAAVAAWQAVGVAESNKSVKQTLIKWLNKNAATYNLLDDNNEPMKQSIEEVAKIANWEPTGGIPKTASKVPQTVGENKKDSIDFVSNDFDLEADVPF